MLEILAKTSFTDLLLVFIAIMAWRVSNKVRWLTGCLESHSEKMLWLEFQRGIEGSGERPISVIWFDPDRPSKPRRDYTPDKEVDFDPLYLAVPTRERQGTANIVTYLWRKLQGVL